MYGRWVLTALLVWPLIAGAVVLLVPGRLAKYVALAASLIEFAISVPLWWTFVPDGGMQFLADHAWIQAWGIHYSVGIDGISLFLVLLTTFLMPLSILGSWSYITKREGGFYTLLLVLTTGMIGVFVALDLFLFYVMWEVMLIPMYFIIECGAARTGCTRRSSSSSTPSWDRCSCWWRSSCSICTPHG